MNLLITTQKVDKNDDILGFFHDWILEFAKNYKNVIVICLQKGEYDLPKNVKVLSLGKEEGVSKPEYFRRFYSYIIAESDNYDKVFVHMNPIYMALGGPLWRLWGKKSSLWYLHRNVDLKLKIAHFFANTIFSASKESFQLPSNKVKIVGHGINIDRYKCSFRIRPKKYDVITVGRLSEIKNQKLLIKATDILVKKKRMKNIKVGLIGWFSSDKDKIYYDELKELVENKKLTKNIIFIGSKPSRETINYYCDTKVSVNLCPTGGLDKVVLESMACGVPAIALNKTFVKIFDNSRMILKKESPQELADKIEDLLNVDVNFRNNLRNIVVENYSLKDLIKKIKNNL